MHKVEDYRKHAEECLRLAGRAREPAERDMLLNMAKTWEELASVRAEHIAQDRRMSGASIPIDKLNASNDD